MSFVLTERGTFINLKILSDVRWIPFLWYTCGVIFIPDFLCLLAYLLNLCVACCIVAQALKLLMIKPSSSGTVDQYVLMCPPYMDMCSVMKCILSSSVYRPGMSNFQID